jgi:hypothetical protein
VGRRLMSDELAFCYCSNIVCAEVACKFFQGDDWCQECYNEQQEDLSGEVKQGDGDEVHTQGCDNEDDVDALLASVDALLIETAKPDFETEYLLQKKAKLIYHLEDPPFNDECISAACYKLQELLGRSPASPTAVTKSDIGSFIEELTGDRGKHPRVQALARDLLSHWDVTATDLDGQ